MGLPTNSNHLSDQARDQMIEDYAGAVDSQFAKKSIMRTYFRVDPLKNTDTRTVRQFGRTTLGKVTPGVRPDATSTGTNRVQVVVDTTVYARNNVSQLGDIQTDFNVRAEIGRDHGKEIAKFFDEAFLIQGIKGAYAAAPTGLNNAIGGGLNSALAAANDELDPDKLYKAISDLLTEQEEADVDIEDSTIFVRPTQYQVLLNNDKLLDRDFSMDNGDFANGRFKALRGARVVSTARIPTAAITGHHLSNTENSNAYDVSVAEAKAVAIIMQPQSLLAAEALPLNSDIWYNREEKQWFIDSSLAFGVTNRRPDLCAVVNKA